MLRKKPFSKILKIKRSKRNFFFDSIEIQEENKTWKFTSRNWERKISSLLFDVWEFLDIEALVNVCLCRSDVSSNSLLCSLLCSGLLYMAVGCCTVLVHYQLPISNANPSPAIMEMEGLVIKKIPKWRNIKPCDIAPVWAFCWVCTCTVKE